MVGQFESTKRNCTCICKAAVLEMHEMVGSLTSWFLDLSVFRGAEARDSGLGIGRPAADSEFGIRADLFRN